MIKNIILALCALSISCVYADTYTYERDGYSGELSLEKKADDSYVITIDTFQETGNMASCNLEKTGILLDSDILYVEQDSEETKPLILKIENNKVKILLGDNGPINCGFHGYFLGIYIKKDK